MTKKYFIITIDTEADNQWDSNHDNTTENSNYLPRFQKLAEKYGFKPVWLTTYEMAEDEKFVKYFKEKQDEGLCEIGMHLHAWNTPPDYKLLKKTNERSYLIEYPVEIMKQKIIELDTLLTRKFGIKPISHRAGRWAMNDSYFNLLIENGYKIDCSVTPHIDWSNKLGESGKPGSNYKSYNAHVFLINNELLEVPVTIKKIHVLRTKGINNIRSFLGEIRRFFCGRFQWIRPDRYYYFNGIKKVIIEYRMM